MPASADAGRRISLGLFTERARAERRAESVRAMGLKAEVAERKLPSTVYWVDLAPQPGMTTVPLQELFAQGVSSKVSVQTCPPAAAAPPRPASAGAAVAPGAPVPARRPVHRNCLSLNRARSRPTQQGTASRPVPRGAVGTGPQAEKAVRQGVCGWCRNRRTRRRTWARCGFPKGNRSVQGSERKPTPGAAALRGLEISQCQSVRQLIRKAFMRTPWREPAGLREGKGHFSRVFMAPRSRGQDYPQSLRRDCCSDPSP